MSDESEGLAESGTVSRPERRLEIAATVLLSIAAVATAWSGYQASLWDGIQSSDYTQASAARTKASQNHLEGNQNRIIDVDLLEGYLSAQAQGLTSLAAFYESRFREEFKPAFEAWKAFDPMNNPAAPKSPLHMPEYRPAAEEKAQELNAQADERFETGEAANHTSDTYVATTLFFASVLFFAAISERFEYRPARIGLLTLASTSLVVGVFVALSQRVTWS